jgi:hypothetical protein
MPPSLSAPEPGNPFTRVAMRRVLGSLSMFTMPRTAPQVLTTSIAHQAYRWSGGPDSEARQEHLLALWLGRAGWRGYLGH